MANNIPDKVIEHLCRRVLNTLKDQKLLEFKASENAVFDRMVRAVQDDLAKEVALEEEARKLLEQYRGAIDRGEVNEHKMFLMIRKQLIKQKKLVI